MSGIELSVIIVTYKNLHIVVDCLDSIIRHNDIGKKLETIIVDNSPDDKIYTYVKCNYQDVTIIKNENKGFGEGNNVGAKNAQGDYLLFLNPDTILIKPVFRFAINQFKKDNRLAMFGVKLVNKDLKRNMSYYWIDKTGFIAAQTIKTFNTLDFFIEGCMFIAGADMFIRKEAFMQCGMFDENIFMYMEEADLTRRIRQLGFKTAYFHKMQIIHLEGQTTDDGTIALKRRLESTRYYCEKYKLNFIDRINSELRYSYFKLFIYKVLRMNNKALILRNNIAILKGFGEKNA